MFGEHTFKLYIFFTPTFAVRVDYCLWVLGRNAGIEEHELNCHTAEWSLNDYSRKPTYYREYPIGFFCEVSHGIPCM